MSISAAPRQDLAPIIEKVSAGERLTLEDGLTLYNSPDLLTIAQLANQVNLSKNGEKVYFIQNMYINPTNVCEARCAFCGFRRDPGEEGAYTMSPEEVLEYVGERFTENIREFHIVGGHNHTVPFDYYLNIISILKKHYPQVTIKAYTAAEIEFFSRLTGRSMEEVLKELIDAGVDTLPGGGAEILTERYRAKMSPDKASTDQWLECHRIAHSLGMKTHVTMLYGSIETLEERLIHMIRVRELQDETGGFLVLHPPGRSAAEKERFDQEAHVGHGRSQNDRHQPPDAGQFPAHQILLDQHRHPAHSTLHAFRSFGHPRHPGGRAHQPLRRRPDPNRPHPGRAGLADQRSQPDSRGAGHLLQ